MCSAAGKGCAILFEQAPTPSRDGGTGRRSGLKIRRPLRSWGFDPPSRHHSNIFKTYDLSVFLANANCRVCVTGTGIVTVSCLCWACVASSLCCTLPHRSGSTGDRLSRVAIITGQAPARHRHAGRAEQSNSQSRRLAKRELFKAPARGGPRRRGKIERFYISPTLPHTDSDEPAAAPEADALAHGARAHHDRRPGHSHRRL